MRHGSPACSAGTGEEKASGCVITGVVIQKKHVGERRERERGREGGREGERERKRERERDVLSVCTYVGR